MRLIHTIILAALSLTATSQDLTTEVVVDRTVSPDEPTAVRLSGLTPTLILPGAKTYTLSTAEYSQVAPIDRTYTRMQPAISPLLPEQDGYRGYAAIGWFPKYNLGLSAGYRAIRTERTKLSVYGQFDGMSYKPYDEGRKNTYNGGRIGAAYSHKMGTSSKIDASVAFHYASAQTFYTESQSLSNVDIAARYTDAIGGIGYNVGLRLNADKYGDVTFLTSSALSSGYDGLSQQRYTLDGGATYRLDDTSVVGADASFDFLHSSGVAGSGTLNRTSQTYGVIAVNPWYKLATGTAHIRIGLKADAATGGGSKAHIAGDIVAGLRPSPQFACELRLAGGDLLNPISDLRSSLSPFMIGMWYYDRSYLPYSVDLKFTAGRFHGFAASFRAGYAKADNWLMITPAFALTPLDIKGGYLAIDLSYQANTYDLSLSGRITSASHTGNAYYLDRDRAKYVIDAQANIRPIAKLSVGADYQYRGHRAVNLRNVSNLGVHASYQITAQLSAFARLDNLLDRSYGVLPYVDAQGLSGLAGITYRF